MDFQRFMDFMKRKNMKFNAILPLKWQNTADIVAILVGLKRETVSLMCRKCARRNCGTMIAFFPKRKMAETAFLALLHTEWCTKRCFCVLTERRECGNNVSG